MLRLDRMIQALARSNQAMARARDEPSYLKEVCRIVMEQCGYHLVWIGYRVPDAAKSIRPVAWSGFDDSYMETLRVTWAAEEWGRGPAGNTIRTGLPTLCRDLATDPLFLPWRQEALARGYASALSLPLLTDGEAFGMLGVYSDRPDAFPDAQVKVLGELASDLAYGILTLRLRESERRAQEALRESTLNLQRLNEELERKVQERTGELVRANAALTIRILDRDRALEALEQSEEKLRHAMKLEAIGTLAGGVAHDFNNLLQVIGGHSEMALDDLEHGLPPRQELEAVQRAVHRGAALTRQLLALSRRQVLAAEIIDLNSLFRELEPFFLRVVHEDIRLVFQLQPDLGLVEADPGQMEQVIINLVVNAKDAMPRGGTLTLETRNQGPRVAFSVSDTGQGMAKDVLARIFEPFYTTKAAGKGTGLGLSIALGTVEQSGGTLDVSSNPGSGTTFSVTLPRTAAGLEKRAPEPAPEPGTGTGTLLVVEDDSGVRHLTAHHLTAAGYQVLEAGNGIAAVALLRCRPEPVHLLLTDVVMPGMNGAELAGHAQALRPELRVLFMSGYPDDVLAGAGDTAAAHQLIAKPFGRATLLAAVRKALAGREAGSRLQ